MNDLFNAICIGQPEWNNSDERRIWHKFFNSLTENWNFLHVLTKTDEGEL